MKAPAVFVSSTFYNLKQIRADLKDFITEMGLVPVISEYDSFPVDPSVSAVENCLKVVDQSADIFVVSISISCSSVTRKEMDFVFFAVTINCTPTSDSLSISVCNVHRMCTSVHSQNNKPYYVTQFTVCTNVRFVHFCMNRFRGDVSNKIRCKAPRNVSKSLDGISNLNHSAVCISPFIGSCRSESHLSIATRDTPLL